MKLLALISFLFKVSTCLSTNDNSQSDPTDFKFLPPSSSSIYNVTCMAIETITCDDYFNWITFAVTRVPFLSGKT